MWRQGFEVLSGGDAPGLARGETVPVGAREPGNVRNGSPRLRTQCAVAFSAPSPVFARTSNSLNLCSELGSRLIIVPTKAPMNPSGMLRIPGFSSGNHAFA